MAKDGTGALVAGQDPATYPVMARRTLAMARIPKNSPYATVKYLSVASLFLSPLAIKLRTSETIACCPTLG